MSNNIYDFVSILILSVLIISWLTDITLRATWNKTYFTRSLTLFEIRIPVENHHANIPSKLTFEKQLHSTWHGSLAFKEIHPNIYAFRERFFQFKLMRSSSSTHGLLIFDNATNQVIVKGFANWFSLLCWLIWFSIVTVYFLLNPTAPSSSLAIIFSILGFIPTIGWVYIVEYRRFFKVASIAAEEWTQ